MSEREDRLVDYAILAIESAAEELGVPALTLARRLQDAEIARLVHLLNAATQHVDNPGLRHRIEDLLMAVTEGRMPSQAAETELDWALRVARRRRVEGDQQDRPAGDPGE